MKEYIVHAPENNVLAVEEFKTFYGEPIEPLTRCKDCVYWRKSSFFDNTMTCHYVIGGHEYYREANDYCSQAERREK